MWTGGCGILVPGAFEWAVGSPASAKATCSDDRAACDKHIINSTDGFFNAYTSAR